MEKACSTSTTKRTRSSEVKPAAVSAVSGSASISASSGDTWARAISVSRRTVSSGPPMSRHLHGSAHQLLLQVDPAYAAVGPDRAMSSEAEQLQQRAGGG